MSGKYLIVVTAALALLTASVPVYSHTIDYAPSWRGDDRSTYQNWTFDSDADPAAAETYANDYGVPVADITVGLFGSGWWNDELEFGAQSGYWDIGGADGGIVIDIDNAIGGDYKLINLQITYWQAIGGVPAIDIPGAQPYMPETWLDEQVEFDTLGSWRLMVQTFIITPNPDREQIILTGDVNGSIIDQIIVDTVCIPEPGTLVLLLSGAMLLARKRR